ncbi:tRNA(Ile)-lysidine synthase [Neptunitalea chrysea]|uniref:tRNA(Ile)-lysidine synthase n=1 Tax=Neptunitalea chrysea TaxID=1647581 RepID=A0A9W6B4G3_9FLAO|nr:tRNA lysidine(34) synthetase TilS [Neptunitalea chrysea]GLB52345.1 tRNA(Ile)-lysidine synthase [Neptunitalea chrysea]
MFSEFKHHILKTFPDVFQKKLLLAVSGGVDSMVLLHLFKQLHVKVYVAHCNFQLRGEESDGDEKQVKEVAEFYDFPFFTVRFDTLQYANEKGLNTQLAARELRYNWFYELCEAHYLDTIVIAHHANDRLETFLINLSRGTGIEGLSGIPEVNNKVIRPLLPFSRETILTYAKEQSIKWRDDSSNASDKYLRNNIRHHIVPLLEELHPNFLNNFIKTQTFLTGTKEILETQIAEVKARLFVKEEEDVFKISIAFLQDLTPLSAYLYELFKGYGFTAWKDLENLLKGETGKKIVSDSHELSKHQNNLLLRPLSYESEVVYSFNKLPSIINEPLNLTIEMVNEMQERGESIIYVDREKLNLPLIVRKRENGDYFYPFGMRGKKKVSKFYKDEKYSVIDKDTQWLLCSGTDIIWIIGKRADQRFSVTNITTSILKIQLQS